MTYQNQSILRDTNGDPIPQYYNEMTKQFEPLKGSEVYTIYRNSNEMKPTEDIDKGVSLFEIDTTKVYMFDGQRWVEI